MTWGRLVVVGLLVGCGGGVPVPDGEWVGRMDSSDAWVAIRADGGKLAAYVCGGPDTLETHTRWWSGAAAADVSLESDGWTIEATLGGGQAGGTLTDVDGNEEAFSLDELPDGGVAGLFTGFDSDCRAGVIVQEDESVQGAWCSSDGLFAQVTPVTPVSMDGFEVTADTAIGERTFDVERVVPSEVTP